MKKILSLVIIGLLCTPMFSVFIPHVFAQEMIVFQDDFESYAVGTFPSSGGWQIVWNGAGSQYQVITNSYYASPTKSLQLRGRYGYSVVVKKDFSSNSNLIGYEAKLMSPPGGGCSVAFCNIPIEAWGRYYACVGFSPDGFIWACSHGNENYQQLQPYTPYTWYKIRVLIDRTARTYDVWVDDVLKGDDIPIADDPWEILSLDLQVGWVNVNGYFDDVKVFSVLSNFEASITPTEITTSLGGAVSYDINIRNYQETTSNLTLDVVDLDPSWFLLERKEVYLLPGGVASVRLNLFVPEDPLAVGFHTFSVTVFDGSVQKILNANLTVVLNPIMSDLEPKNGIIIGSTDVAISWKTSSSASSEVYIKRSDESEFTRWDGEYGIEHFVHIYNLSRNTDYMWYVRSSTLYGNVSSEVRSLHISNGLSFTQDVYTVNIERDYAQKTGISVINTDTQPHDLLLQITNSYDDLIVGFVGAGSVDQTVNVSPDEARVVDLYIHAQDAKLSLYTLKINLTNLGVEEIVDYAVVIVNVRQPNIDLEVLEISVDNATLTKTYNIINHGDTVTDLQVLPEEALKTWVQIEPNINHALLRTGESISFKAVPVLTQSFTAYDGNIQVAASGETQNVSYAVALPPGKQVFLVTLENRIWSITFNDWYCTNHPRIDERFTIPSYIKKTVDGAPNIDKASVKVCFSLPWARDTYRPHNVHLLINGVEIGSLTNTIPEGVYLFPFDGYLLNYASEGLAENVLTLQMDNLNGGHYVVSANMEIILHVRKIEIAVVASNITEAEALAEKLGGTIAEFADFAVYPEGITFSNLQPKEGETITILANIFNFGTLQGNNVPASLYLDSMLIETKTVSIIPSLSTQTVSFVWTATKGTHTFTIKINEEQVISEKDYSNNQASKSITVMGIPPEVEAYLVDIMWELLGYDEEHRWSVEKGGTIVAYFKVRARLSSGNTVPANDVSVSIITSSDSAPKVYTSKPFNGKDGIIKVGPCETANYDGTIFYIRVIDGTFYGIPVVSNNFLIGCAIKPRTLTTGVGFDLDLSAALGVDLKGELEDFYYIRNDGYKALNITASRTAKMGIGVKFPTEFSVILPDYKVEAGVDWSLIAGLVGGTEYSYSDLDESTQANLIRYLVTLGMLDYVASAIGPANRAVVDALRSLIISLIPTPAESPEATTYAGGYFGGTLEYEAALRVDMSDLSFGGYGKTLVGKVGGGVGFNFEIAAEGVIRKETIGIRGKISIGAATSFDLGFVTVSGVSQEFKIEIVAELQFNKNTKELQTIVLEFSFEVTGEQYAQAEFGGLLECLETANLQLASSKTYRITTTYEIPVGNAGTLYDYLKSAGLYVLSPTLGLIDYYELGKKIDDSLKEGNIASYEITMEEENTGSFALEVDLAVIEFEVEFNYIESKSFVAETGHVTFVDGKLQFWSEFHYPVVPNGVNATDFLVQNFIYGAYEGEATATVIQMQEAQSKLYLHVYDADGNHVGFNVAENTTDLEIPGSAYYDNLFGRTEILLPYSIRSFKVTVDGTNAHFAQESFLLGIYVFGQANCTILQLEEQEIEKGTLRDYIVTILNNDTIIYSAIQPLSVSIGPLSASILAGQSVTFTSTTSGGYLPYTYQWFLNGNPVSGATSPSWTFTPTTSGIYYVHLKVTDDEGNSAQSGVARITATTVPVGGYSVPIQTYTKTASVIPYIALTAILTLVFTTVKRKTTKKTRRSP